MAPAEPGRVVGEPARGVAVRGCFVAGPVRDLRLPQQASSGRARRTAGSRSGAGGRSRPPATAYADRQPVLALRQPRIRRRARLRLGRPGRSHSTSRAVRADLRFVAYVQVVCERAVVVGG